MEEFLWVPWDNHGNGNVLAPFVGMGNKNGNDRVGMQEMGIVFYLKIPIYLFVSNNFAMSCYLLSSLYS